MKKPDQKGLIGLDYSRGVDRKLLTIEILQNRLTFEELCVLEVSQKGCELVGVVQINGKNILHAMILEDDQRQEILQEVDDDEMSNLAVDLYQANRGKLFIDGRVVQNKE